MYYRLMYNVCYNLMYCIYIYIYNYIINIITIMLHKNIIKFYYWGEPERAPQLTPHLTAVQNPPNIIQHTLCTVYAQVV